MKLSQLRKMIRTQIGKSLKQSFYRLPKDVIEKDVYNLKKYCQSTFDWILQGNDVQIDRLQSIKKQLENIIRQAKKFDKFQDVPNQYKYNGDDK